MKSVFVLGAGFSVAAGLPMQSELLKKSLLLKPTKLVESAGFGIINATKAKGDIGNFLKKAFPEVDVPRLEDVFTCLDLAITRRQYFRGYPWQELYEIRDALTKLINSFLHLELRAILDARKDFYEKVAIHFMERRLEAGQETDCFSVVQLNWDNVLEEKIFICIKEMGWERKVDIDYCCFSNPLGDSCHVPSLRQKALKLFNIKIQKLHGSINWLVCPNCDRMFTGLGGTSKPGELYLTEHRCPECLKAISESPILQQYLVTPTYAKVFDNTHIQMIWHNAYMDLSSADEIVFIGYSLPEADYHVRALLLRAIRPEARIHVVLARKDAPKRIGGSMVHGPAASHYQELFGDERITFHFDGAEDFFVNTYKVGILGRRKKRLARLYREGSAKS